MQQQGTTACQMRDELFKLRCEKRITPTQITKRLTAIDMPDWLRGEIIQMTSYNQYSRITCPIEQAMLQAVCNHIVKELMDNEKLTNS